MTCMDLVEFLKARLDEDEQAARAATAGPWECGESYPDAGSITADRPRPDLNEEWDSYQRRSIANESASGDIRLADALHIARHDPARVLADIAAKRRLIERYSRAVAATPSVSSYVRGQDDGYRQACLDAIRDAAEIHADHPDYRQEWRP